MTANDDELLPGLGRGDPQACRDLWDRFYPVVYRHVLLKEARGGSVRDTEDVTQDAFVRAYKSVEKFNGDSSLKTWLIKLAHNAAIDFYRSAHYRIEDVGHDQALEAREASARYESASAAPAEPLQQYLDRERRDLCHHLLAQLNEEQRAVVIYRQIDGLSTADTAAAIGKSEGAVKMLLLRALQSLNEKGTELAAHRKEVATHG